MNQNLITMAFRSLSKWAMLIFCLMGFSQIKAQRNLTPNANISNYAFVDELDRPIQGNWSGVAGAAIAGYYKVDYDLSSLGGSIVTGDYLTYQLPDSFTPQAVTQSLKVNNVEVAVLTVDTTAKIVKITFNENASRMANYHGKIYAPVRYNPTDGENQITYPDGTKGPVILWTTKTPTPPGTVTNEVVSKIGYEEPTDPTKIRWRVFINRSKQDFENKEVIVKDRLLSYGGRGDEVVTYLLDSFTLHEANYTNPTLSGQYNYTYFNRYEITRDEEEYKRKLAAGQRIAFLKIISEEVDGYNNQGEVIKMQRGFELHLGNSVGDKSYFLQYYTRNPQSGTRVMNSASLLVEGKETLPWENKNGEDPKSPGVISIVPTTKDKNSTIEADLKDRLRVTKYDKETGEGLAGAIFNLQKADGTGPVYTLTSDADGFAQSEILDAGDYILTEISAPAGYELNSSTTTPVTIVYNQPTLIAIGNYKTSSVSLRSFTVNKVWNGIDENIKKPTVNLILQKNGEDYLSAERKQLENGQTSVTWERLPATNADGTAITYTARETEAEGFVATYSHTENSTTITNTLKIDKEFCLTHDLMDKDRTTTLTPMDPRPGDRRAGQKVSEENKFENDEVPLYNTKRPVYYVERGSGLLFNIGAGDLYEEYTITMQFKIATNNDGYVRLLDLRNGTVDQGVYRYRGGNLNFYGVGNIGDRLLRNSSNEFVMLTLTRNKNGLVRIFFNGQFYREHQDNAGTYKVHDTGNIIFLKDDTRVRNEEDPVKLSFIRINNNILTDQEISDMYSVRTCEYTPSYCHRPANATGVGLDTNHGITLLNRAGDDGDGNPNNDWPMLRKGAWTALESNTKGLVFTRMTTAQINAISNPQEGMISYDTDAKCLKIYNGTKWSCFSTPSCPEN